MLVLTRKAGDSIVISEDIVITVLSMRGGSIKVGISAPADVLILRGELIDPSKNKIMEIIEEDSFNADHSNETIETEPPKLSAIK